MKTKLRVDVHADMNYLSSWIRKETIIRPDIFRYLIFNEAFTFLAFIS
jgi:hypothetical protein